MTKNITLTNTVTNNTVQKQVQQNFDLSIFEIIDGKVNLTKLASSQGREIKRWLALTSTKNFLNALKQEDAKNVLVIKQGKGEQGTFGSREVALKVAQWISVDFEVWCIKQIDTLLQTGKVELAQPKPTSSIESSRLLANQVLELCNKLEAEQKENELKSSIIDEQRAREDELINIKAKHFKTVQTERKQELGREINQLVMKVYFDKASGDYKQAHSLAHEDYARATGKVYLGADKSSYESKLDYLNFLKSKTKNFIQKLLNI